MQGQGNPEDSRLLQQQGGADYSNHPNRGQHPSSSAENTAGGHPGAPQFHQPPSSIQIGSESSGGVHITSTDSQYQRYNKSTKVDQAGGRAPSAGAPSMSQNGTDTQGSNTVLDQDESHNMPIQGNGITNQHSVRHNSQHGQQLPTCIRMGTGGTLHQQSQRAQQWDVNVNEAPQISNLDRNDIMPGMPLQVSNLERNQSTLSTNSFKSPGLGSSFFDSNTSFRSSGSGVLTTKQPQKHLQSQYPLMMNHSSNRMSQQQTHERYDMDQQQQGGNCQQQGNFNYSTSGVGPSQHSFSPSEAFISHVINKDPRFQNNVLGLHTGGGMGNMSGMMQSNMNIMYNGIGQHMNYQHQPSAPISMMLTNARPNQPYQQKMQPSSYVCGPQNDYLMQQQHQQQFFMNHAQQAAGYPQIQQVYPAMVPPSNMMVPMNKKPSGIWICDICNVARFASYAEAVEHEKSCDGSSTRNSPKKSSNMITSRRYHPLVVPTAEQRAANAKKLTLSLPDDRHWLSDLLCLIREHIEVFAATPDDIAIRNKKGGIKQPILVGRVGIRCLHCSALPPDFRAKGSVSYPFSIRILHQSVRNWQRYHFNECQAIPTSMRESYEALKSVRSHSGNASLQYWIDAAKKIGMMDTTNGIFLSDDAPHILNAKKEAENKSAEPTVDEGEQKEVEEVAPTVPVVTNSDPSTETKESNDNENNDIEGIIEPNIEGVVLAREEDRCRLPRFLLKLLCALEPTKYSEEDRRDTTKKFRELGYVGVCCKYCKDSTKKNSRFFPLSASTFANLTKPYGHVYNHIFTCKMTPIDVKENLQHLQHHYAADSQSLTKDWNQLFYDRLWERLHHGGKYYSMDPDDLEEDYNEVGSSLTSYSIPDTQIQPIGRQQSLSPEESTLPPKKRSHDKIE